MPTTTSPISLAAAALAALPLLAAGASAAENSLLGQVTSWTYQLQDADIRTLASQAGELLVIDYSRNGQASGAFSRSEIEALKTTPGGRRRLVLAYLSIGEAEDYRYYWQPEWEQLPPEWLMEENPEWQGNYAVRYWASGWQSILFGTPTSYLDIIIDHGFDGVYLDRVDTFEHPDQNLGLQSRFSAMIALVTDLANYARAKQPDFLIIPQNGEELLADTTYRTLIDALVKEDLLYGLAGDGERNANSEIRASLDYLSQLKVAGKPVFLVEYLSSDEAIEQARSDAAALEMPLFIARRELDHAISR